MEVFVEALTKQVIYYLSFSVKEESKNRLTNCNGQFQIQAKSNRIVLKPLFTYNPTFGLVGLRT
jgi:hypothetical protein